MLNKIQSWWSNPFGSSEVNVSGQQSLQPKGHLHICPILTLLRLRNPAQEFEKFRSPSLSAVLHSSQVRLVCNQPLALLSCLIFAPAVARIRCEGTQITNTKESRVQWEATRSHWHCSTTTTTSLLAVSMEKGKTQPVLFSGCWDNVARVRLGSN